MQFCADGGYSFSACRCGNAPAVSAAEGSDFTPEHRSIPNCSACPAVPQVLVCFFCYCALEATAGMWAASYCTLVRGIDATTAASWTSTFYLGITVGRGISGFLTLKFNDQKMISPGPDPDRPGHPAGAAAGGAGGPVCRPGDIGLGCAPIYPSIIHETPANFGRALSLAMTGVQMAFAYVGSCLMPPLFGLLAQYVSPALYPWYLAVVSGTDVSDGREPAPPHPGKAGGLRAGGTAALTDIIQTDGRGPERNFSPGRARVVIQLAIRRWPGWGITRW